MNFFERQDASRRMTRWLIVLFALAVISVIAAVNMVVILTITQFSQERTPPPLLEWIAANPDILVATTALVASIIGFASWRKSAMLGRGGGGVVACSLGGVRVSPDTSDWQQRRLLNVVEEMAIASGVPMPEVYLLEQERGINAFAAGHNPANAAIAVTRGTLEALNRAELQSLIAHEFSHILNGDMRLNIRLMGLQFGLLAIALIGRMLFFFGSRKRDPQPFPFFISLFVAVGFWIIGYLGLFLGRLIQAAVSRHREAWADASAVQFTRDPTGLRGALVKIGAVSRGSVIGNPKVDEVAHMLFASGMSRLFATHPSLEERLKAIDPSFDPQEFVRARAELVRMDEQKKAYSAAKAKPAMRLESLINLLGGAAPDSVAGLVGNPSTVHMQLARDIRKSLPDAIVSASHHPQSARELMLALALDSNAETRERQRLFISLQLGYQTADRLVGLLDAVDLLEPEQRMPVLLRAVPVLRQLTRDERMQLMSTLNGMLQREGGASLQSYVLRKLAQVHLNDDLNPLARTRQLPLLAVQKDIQVLFSVLAQHGHIDAAASRRAYEAGVHHLLPRERPSFASLAHWAQPLDLALSRLDQLAPIMKEPLVDALLKTVTHDQKLTLGEAELLRAVCAAVHCPLPPLHGTSELTTKLDDGSVSCHQSSGGAGGSTGGRHTRPATLPGR